MRNVWIIARREYKRYFTSWIAYIVAFVFIIILGIFFWRDLVTAIQYSVYYQSPPPGAEIVTGGLMIFLLIAGMPAITMRTISEEMRSGTMELLLTSPVRDWELVVGKWLGAFLYMLSLLAFTLVLPLMLNFIVQPGIDKGVLISGYLGLILMTATLAAIGVFISSLFSNQVIVFFVTLITFLIIYYVLQPLGGNSSSGLGNQILTNINFIQHYINLYQGTIDLKDIVYYLSVTTLALVFGTVSIEVRRWR
jgi:ABC-2 type transport system permease protein